MLGHRTRKYQNANWSNLTKPNFEPLTLPSKRPNFKPTRTKFELWIRVRHNTTTNWRKPVLSKWRVNLQYKIQSQKFQALAIVAFFIQKYMNGVSHSALIMEKQCKLLYNYLVRNQPISISQWKCSVLSLTWCHFWIIMSPLAWQNFQQLFHQYYLYKKL